MLQNNTYFTWKFERCLYFNNNNNIMQYNHLVSFESWNDHFLSSLSLALPRLSDTNFSMQLRSIEMITAERMTDDNVSRKH